MSSEPPRRPSDTQPIDREQLSSLLEDARETLLECPNCSGIPRKPHCPTCPYDPVLDRNLGVVTIDEWRRWMTTHSPRAMITCPKCFGEGAVLQATIKGQARMCPCSLCQGNKKVAANFAAAWEREQAREDGEP